MTNQDLKSLSLEELNKRVTTLSKNISIESRRRNSVNSAALQQLQWLRSELVNEINERYMLSNTRKALSGSLTNDNLSAKESSNDSTKK